MGTSVTLAAAAVLELAVLAVPAVVHVRATISGTASIALAGTHGLVVIIVLSGVVHVRAIVGVLHVERQS